MFHEQWNDGRLDDGRHGLMMFIALLLFFVILGATVYTAVRLLMRKARVEDRPLMLLKERFVRGEIEREEYESKRNELS